MKTLTESDREHRVRAVQDALECAAREGQPISPEAAADLAACARGEITAAEVRRRIIARLHADPRYRPATYS